MGTMATGAYAGWGAAIMGTMAKWVGAGAAIMGTMAVVGAEAV